MTMSLPPHPPCGTSRRLTGAVPSLLLLFLTCSLLFTSRVAVADVYVVADVDGSVEGYAALTTILSHGEYANQLKMVMTNGATWGYAPTVLRNLCRFTAFAGRPTVTVSLGELASWPDAYDGQTYRGNCVAIEGFPSTPRDAALRSMPYSRADVSGAFGGTRTLPHSTDCSYTVSASNTFITLLEQVTVGTDKIVYLQFGSATNLASIATAVEGRHRSDLSQKLRSSVEVHALEAGYSGASDSPAMQSALSSSFGLHFLLYPPLFYNSPSIAFSDETWSRFVTVGTSASAPKLVNWLYKAWDAKRATMVANGGSIQSFYNEVDPATCLMTLCAVDASLQSLCTQYRSAVYSVAFTVASSAASMPTPSTTVLVASGNNVTMPSFYTVSLNPSTGSDGTMNTEVVGYVYNTGVSTLLPGQSSSLAQRFWEVWMSVLSG